MTLSEFFKENNKAALAFSGGVDSAYLLCAAADCSADVQPYFVKSQFQPAFELDDAKRLANDLKQRGKLINSLKIIEADSLSCPKISANGADRCYHCKKLIFSSITAQAEKDGYSLLIDGTNASDDEGDRPGMCALRELNVRSPLRECGLTKDEIRRLSREAGLFTWNKPAYACLATRIPTGEEITADKLISAEKAEDCLFSLGFSDFRVRLFSLRTEIGAKIQLRADQLPKLLENREIILAELKKYCGSVTLDLEVRK